MNPIVFAAAVIGAGALAVLGLSVLALRRRVDEVLKHAKENRRLLRTVEQRLAKGVQGSATGQAKSVKPVVAQSVRSQAIQPAESGPPSWKWERTTEERSPNTQQRIAVHEPQHLQEPASFEASENEDQGTAAVRRRKEILLRIRDPELSGDQLTLLYDELRQLNREHKAWAVRRTSKSR